MPSRPAVPLRSPPTLCLRFAARLPAIAVAVGHAVVEARAGTVARLPARQPLLLREEQTAITVFGGRRLLPLLHSAEMTNCLLD
jgi:hypothetical protein